MYDNKKIDAIKKWLGSGSINIFGRPLAGKDYQGRRLAEIFDGNLVGGGEILRSSTMTERINGYMRTRTGKLIPSDDYVAIVLPYLDQPQLANKPLILSSVGCWHGEEEDVIKAIQKSGHPLKAVIYLDISTDDSYSRWKAREINKDRGNRRDDSEEILKIRFAEFTEKTLPVIDYYRNQGILIEIDGKRTRDEVTNDIINALSEQMNANRV